MKYVRISQFQYLNLDAITRIEIYKTEDIRYCTVHFVDGEPYRCTEEESSVLLPMIDKRIEEAGAPPPAPSIGLD